MKIYSLEFICEGTSAKMNVRARNKIEATMAGFEKLHSWRMKDRVDEIKITEDSRNVEATIEDYR